MFENYYGNMLEQPSIQIDDNSAAFSVKNINIGGNVINRFYGNGVYAPNPFAGRTTMINYSFYDENRNVMPVYRSDGTEASNTTTHSFSAQMRQALVFRGSEFDTLLCLNLAEYESGNNHGKETFHLDKVPSYIKTNGKVFYNLVSDVDIKDAGYNVLYNDDSCNGLMEQIETSLAGKALDINGTGVDADEAIRKLKNMMIRHMNKDRHALRIATYNVKGSGGNNQLNWYMLKRCLEQQGIDICGMQEVSFPLKDMTGKGNLVEFFTGWAFPYVSDNGDAYRNGDGPENEGKNERNLLSTLPIDSTEEYNLTMGTDYRLVAKSVISLPRYMDKRGSENLKMSVYNFQLEVSGSNAQINAREVLDIVAEDENPFIILMGDCNDFSITKEVYKIFKEAGYEPVLGTNSSTVSGTYDFNSIDNFFLSKRIKPLNHNVVWSQDYPWIRNSVKQIELSDHDLVIADVVLDYDDIRCINTQDCSYTSSNGKVWLTAEETVTLTVTPESGKSLYRVLDCMIANNDAIHVNGNTVTIDGSKLIGDVFIQCK